MILNVVPSLDGITFAIIGVVIPITPSRQPTLMHRVGNDDLIPFTDIRRLPASQFVGTSLPALLIGSQIHDPATLQGAVTTRILTLLTSQTANMGRLRGSSWKPAPLRGLVVAFSPLGHLHDALLVSSRCALSPIAGSKCEHGTRRVIGPH